MLSLAYEAARANPKRVLFAEGEEPNVLRAAIAFKEGGYGTPVLVGRDDVYDKLAEGLGVDDPRSYEVLNSRNSPLVGRAVDYLYAKHQRHGMLRREVERMVNQDRNIFAAAMLALGEGDAMITGTTRPFSQSLQPGPHGDRRRGRARLRSASTSSSRKPQTVLIADTAVTERPTAEQLAAIAIRSAAFARRMGQEPRVAFISYTTFGNPPGRHIEELRDAVKLLDTLQTDFEYEGEMGPDVALNHDMQRRILSVQPPDRPGQHPDHAGAAVGQYVVQAAPRAGGESVLGPYPPGHGAAGADRADDRDRVGPGDAGGARGRRRRQTAGQGQGSLITPA